MISRCGEAAGGKNNKSARNRMALIEAAAGKLPWLLLLPLGIAAVGQARHYMML